MISFFNVGNSNGFGHWSFFTGKVALLVLVSTTFFQSCTSESNDAPPVTSESVQPDGLNVKTITFEGAGGLEKQFLQSTPLGFAEQLANPMRLLLVNDHLVMSDEDPNAMLKVFDLKSKERKDDLGVNGYGPGEMMSTWTVSRGNGAQDFWVYDVQLKALNRYEIGQNQREAQKQISFKETPLGLNSVVYVNDSTFGSFFQDGRSIFTQLNDKGESIGQYGSWQALAQSNQTSSEIIAQVYQGFLSIHPEHTHYALSSTAVGTIHLMDLGNRKMYKILGPDGYVPNVSAVDIQGRMTYTPDVENSIHGYISVAFTNDALWALYSGNQWKGKPGEVFNGERVFKFSLEGDLQAVYELDTPVRCIVVDGENRIIYGASDEAEPDIFEFKY